MKFNSILFKFSSAGIAMIVLISAVLTINFFMLLKKDEKGILMDSLSSDIKISILELRRSEKDFLLRDLNNKDFFSGGKTKNLENQESRIKELRKIINKLTELLPDDQKYLGKDLFTYLDDYETNFSNLAGAYRKLGFKDWGLVGKWRDSVHELQERVKSNADKDANIIILELRRSEKDFLLRNDLKYVERVKKHLGLLSDHFTDKKSRELIDNYRLNFLNYLKLRKELGLTENSGLRSEMRSSVMRLFPAADKISVFSKKFREKIRSDIRVISFFVVSAGILISIVIFYIFSKIFVNAIVATMRFSGKMSEGDFTERINMKRNDELGKLSASMNKMSESLSSLIGDVKKGASELGGSVADMGNIIKDISGNTELSSRQNDVVTKNINQLKENIFTIADSVEQASLKMESIAAASDQMNSAIAEVADNAEKTSSAARDAVDNSKRTFNKMEKLDIAADNISKFTFLIEEISEQTKFLALNADIEAARAGNAGKGFKVIADEIRSLASKSAEATSDITDQVTDIQSASSELIKDVKDTISAMENLESYFENVASAVEEQSSTTKEISGNVGLASDDIKAINESVLKTSGVYEDITEKVNEVNSYSKEINKYVGILDDNCSRLEKLSSELNLKTMNFRIKE